MVVIGVLRVDVSKVIVQRLLLLLPYLFQHRTLFSSLKKTIKLLNKRQKNRIHEFSR